MPSTINATPTSSGLISSADASGVLALQTGGTTAVTIDGSQNVGIGTVSPNADSAVFAPVLSVKGGSFDGVFELIGSRADGSATGVGQLRFVQNANTTGKTISYIQGETEGATANNRGGNLQFFTKVNAGSLAERMRIDSSGALLVNTTVAAGTVNFSVAADTTTKNPMSVNNTRTTAATDFSILFIRAGNIVGSVQTSLSATSFVTSSDYRLKENIAPMTGALAKVAQLKPVTYDWKVGGSSQGFIAHELQAVVPDCVTGEKDAVDADGKIKPQGIDTSFLVATLTAAIQEQQALITQLQADVAALKAQP